MRISDWSSDVSSTDLRQYRGLLYRLEGYSGSGEPRVGFDPVRDQHRRRRKAWPRVRVHRAAGPGIEPRAQWLVQPREGHRPDPGRGGDFGRRARHASRVAALPGVGHATLRLRSEEHKSELQSLMRTSFAVFCMKKTKIYSID